MEYGRASKLEDAKATSGPGRELVDKQTVVVEEYGAVDASTFPKLSISPGSPFPDDIKLMREHLHRHQALPRLQTQPIEPQGATFLNCAGSGSSVSPTSDSGWSVLTPTEAEAVMCQKTNDLPNEKDLVDDAAEGGNAVEKETTKEGTEYDDD
ncbi:hypothetical protein DPSP01_001639 [Paraphaeosphaeria sporulosa]|uniref:Uncharacterized protein n=1 Tax=Paraphaeosphaeria sporulosa TaxID=1460663 RepID=A0A177CT54_9PLEO|nr:uncharacterized protein CC84DRAFT_1213464 [Paraphaeosphaeria sporulosa]OAG10102.1 hypothetical protein CC84DRAFT_1213464 [Paraphaeosphaeria sporulosa]